MNAPMEGCIHWLKPLKAMMSGYTHFPATLEVEMRGFDREVYSPDEGGARGHRGSPPPKAKLGVNLGADTEKTVPRYL